MPSRLAFYYIETGTFLEREGISSDVISYNFYEGVYKHASKL